MTINLFVAGDPGSLRRTADAVRQDAGQAESYANAWHHTRTGAEPAWDGHASENYQHYATRQGRSGDDVERVLNDYARAVDDLADSLDAVKARMAHAHYVAAQGGVPADRNAIYPPEPIAQPRPEPPAGRMSAYDAAQHAQAERSYQACVDYFHRQQRAYAEAQAIVTEARAVERAAHERQTAADQALTDGINATPQHGEWEQMAANATSPTAVALSKAATDLETRSSNATRAQLEKAAGGGPFAVRGLWGSMTSAQRAEMTSHFPKLVGSTNGVPMAARDKANRSILARQRAALEEAYAAATRTPINKTTSGGDLEKRQQLRESLDGLNQLEEQLDHKDTFLLGLDTTANNRGQVIVARGNPDTASHVLTMVPGTGADLGGVADGLHRNDVVLGKANGMLPPQQHAAGIVWTNYETPGGLDGAMREHYADAGKQNLSQFQEGLRATHDGPPSTNTLLGHSYGTTLVGETARDFGAHSDNIAFLASPGVGVEHADQLGVPADHVWAGTSEQDPIHTADWNFDILDGLDGTEDQWFGLSPADPTFGAHQIPTDPTTGHSGYWDKTQTVDSLARITAGHAGGAKP